MTNNDVSTHVRALQQGITQAMSAKSGQAFDFVAKLAGDVQVTARETMQAGLLQNYGPLVHKLENEIPLTEDERLLIRQLVVGEVKYYLQYQTAIDERLQSLLRLAELFNRFDNPSDVESLLHLQALAQETRGLVADVGFYYKEKERLERFDAAINGSIDQATGVVLADVIRAMFNSGTM